VIILALTLMKGWTNQEANSSTPTGPVGVERLHHRLMMS